MQNDVNPLQHSPNNNNDPGLPVPVVQLTQESLQELLQTTQELLQATQKLLQATQEVFQAAKSSSAIQVVQESTDEPLQAQNDVPFSRLASHRPPTASSQNNCHCQGNGYFQSGTGYGEGVTRSLQGEMQLPQRQPSRSSTASSKAWGVRNNRQYGSGAYGGANQSHVHNYGYGGFGGGYNDCYSGHDSNSEYNSRYDFSRWTQDGVPVEDLLQNAKDIQFQDRPAPTQQDPPDFRTIDLGGRRA